MAKRRPEDPAKREHRRGSQPSRILLNLLLCLFSCSCSLCQLLTLRKFQLVIASLTSSVSVLPGGSTSIGDGRLVGAGVSQLELFG
mgnify:CR=1 FL=1